MAIDTDRIDDCVPAVLPLGRHDGQRVWKSFGWDAMDGLQKKGMISNPVGRAKSVVLTNEGLERAEQRIVSGREGPANNLQLRNKMTAVRKTKEAGAEPSGKKQFACSRPPNRLRRGAANSPMEQCPISVGAATN
jgi:hypothetical protein